MKKIEELRNNEIFVFGSNEAGIHGKGAAFDAYTKFGARWGSGFGLYGKSFAIPTKDWTLKTLPLSVIKEYVDKFISYAKSRPDLRFLVTPIGCGLAGYKPKQIAPLFKNVPPNVILPEEFIND